MFRKRVLFAVFLAAPVVLHLLGPSGDFLGNLSSMWLAVGAGALLFRTVQLFFIRDLQTGLVWFTKILTDPFNDVRTYWKSPYHLARGELIDPELG
jgi:hypothetical protein